MEIVRIEKVNLVDEVYRQLRQLIVSGQWPEGTKLASENEFAKQFSVSRVVIREALQQLRSEKMIVTRQGVGTYVANPANFGTVDNVINLCEDVYRSFLQFRDAVEIAAIELSKTEANDDDYDSIDACVEQMQAGNDSTLLYSEADYAFHLAVVRSGHNKFLENAMFANQAAITGVFKAMNDVPNAKHFGVTSHREIADLLRKKDIKTVIRLYDEMGKYNMTRLVRFFSHKE